MIMITKKMLETDQGAVCGSHDGHSRLALQPGGWPFLVEKYNTYIFIYIYIGLWKIILIF